MERFSICRYYATIIPCVGTHGHIPTKVFSFSKCYKCGTALSNGLAKKLFREWKSGEKSMKCNHKFCRESFLKGNRKTMIPLNIDEIKKAFNIQ